MTDQNTSAEDNSDSAESGAPDAATLTEAMRQGWKPEAEYEGAPGRWVDAATYLERGKHNKTNLQNELSAMKAQMAAFKKSADDFKLFHQETLARKEEQLQATIRQLRLQRSEAVRDGDDEAALELEDKIDALKAEHSETKAAKAPPAQPDAPAPDPALLAWVADGNQWFEQDVKLQAYAVALAQDLRAKGETLQGRPFMDKITEIMAEEFPAKFKNTRRDAPGIAELPNSRSAPRGKTKADLPATDREFMDQGIREGWFTEKSFIESYFSR